MQWNCFALSVFASAAAKGAYDMSLKSFFFNFCFAPGLCLVAG